MERAGNIISGVFCWLIAAAAGILGFYYTVLPGELSAPAGSSVTGALCGARLVETDFGWGYSVGNLQIKGVNVSRTERRKLVPCGTPFGIKLRTDGVMVISVNKNSPADKAGIKSGDVISSVNSVPVQTNSEIAAAVQLDPAECVIVISRGNGELCVKAEPQRDGAELRLGAWVRDSAAGIGTMTYYDPDTGMFGGLGHPVSDVTTGELMPLSSGEITGAQIYSIVKDKNGEAGELCGDLEPGAIGTLSANTPVGVFGRMNGDVSGKAIPVAFRQEVECGPAVILATTDGSEPQEYSIEIEKINICALNGSKSMIVRITDERLLDATGGIVKGMSGSPIIQNGMLAGAVTHVFINDPTRGYAVFAESMLEEMDKGAAATASLSCIQKNLELSG